MASRGGNDVGGTPAGYRAALDEAWRKLASIPPETAALLTGAGLDIPGQVALEYFGRTVRISWPVQGREGAPGRLESLFPLTGADQVVLLHYLAASPSDSAPRPETDWISFRQLWGGAVYWDAFQRRVIAPLVALFGSDPDLLHEACREVFGQATREAGFGTASTIVQALPNVALAYVLWAGDSEVPPSGTVLFAGRANDWLPTEDLVHLACVPVQAWKSFVLRREREQRP